MVSRIHMVFRHEVKSVNRLVDSLAKQGVYRSSSFRGISLVLYFRLVPSFFPEDVRLLLLLLIKCNKLLFGKKKKAHAEYSSKIISL